MNGALQVADAFAVDEADFEQAPLPTGLQVGGHEFLEVLRPEGVQIQHIFNGQRHRFVHRAGSMAIGRCGSKRPAQA